MSTLAVSVRALLLIVSFIGLCTSTSKILKLHLCIAPSIVTSGIIVLLMLAGMLHILEPMFWFIYGCGFLGILYSALIPPRKLRASILLAIVLTLFSGFLAWMLYSSVLTQSDDISHWGLVARHLLRYDAFPDRNASHVFFQSYPLGASAFIYYVCKTISNAEGMYFIAQNLLFGLFFLPVCAHIHPSKRRMGYPIALAVFVFLFNFARSMDDLRVDMLLGFFGIGISAAILYYRSNLSKALICAIPGMMAVMYMKNSGIFFAAIQTVMLLWIARRNNCSRKVFWGTCVLSVGSFLLAYLFWNLHIRFSFPAALDTKHAISLSAYAAEAASKSPSVLFTISKRFIKSLLSFSPAKVMALIFFLGCAFLMIHGCMVSKADRKIKRSVMQSLIFSIGVYLLWSLMIYLMYIFSMPELEAVSMAGFSCYNSTGLAYSMGLAAIALFAFFGAEHTPIYWPVRLLQWGSAIFIAVILLIFCLPESLTRFHIERNNTYPEGRAVLIQAREDYSLTDGKQYAFFCFDENLSVGPYHEYYRIKYEFETADIFMLAENPEEPGIFLAGTREDNSIVSSIQDQLDIVFSTCDALFVLDQSNSFEAQLDEYITNHKTNTPIIYTYEYTNSSSQA